MSKRYSKNEIEFLKEYAKDYTVEELAKKLNRPTLSIYHRLRRLNIKPLQINPHYTKIEEQFILDNFKNPNFLELVKEAFPDRHPNSVLRKGYELGGKKGFGYEWKPSEIEVIKKFGGILFDYELNELLPHISPSLITRKRLDLNIPGRRRYSDEKKIKFDGQMFTLEKKQRNYVGRYNGRATSLHRAIFEKELGRKLTKEESVHHIDGDYSNNKRENLYLFNSHNLHMKAHRSLELIVFELLKSGVVQYDRTSKIYFHTL